MRERVFHLLVEGYGWWSGGDGGDVSHALYSAAAAGVFRGRFRRRRGPIAASFTIYDTSDQTKAVKQAAL